MRVGFTIILGFVTMVCFGQHIEGRVKDKSADVEFANVILYSLPDSSLMTSEVTDVKGEFSFDNVDNGQYFLMVSFIGYKDSYSETFIIKDNDHTVELTIEEDTEMLGEVEIKARKPLLEQKPDKLVVNVEENITNLSGNLMDVMKKVPGVIVVNDRISMAGQSNLTILINGKTTEYMDVQSLLRDMPGDNIKSIEVIQQPGAEYEAAGAGPIINVILKKNSLLGTNGSLSFGLGKNEQWIYNTGLRLSHYKGSVNIQGSVSYNQNAWYDELEIVRRVPVRNVGIIIGNDIYSQTNQTPSDPRSIRTGLSVDWDLSERHRLGVSGRYITSHTDRVGRSSTDITYISDSEFSINTDNEAIRDWDFMSINPYYSFEIDTSGQKLDLDVNVASFDRDFSNVLLNDVLIPDRPDQRNIQLGDVNILAAKLDYSLPISDLLVMRLGAKYSDASLDNDLQVSDKDSQGEWIRNSVQSNNFLFDERIAAAYVKGEWKSGDWQGTLGLRYEDSKSEGYSVTLDSTLNRDISKLFPSASISKRLFGELGANLAYSYRIERPSYSTLNPFVYYYDPYTSDRGNQNVLPEFTHSLKYSFTFDGQPFLNFEYKRTNDAMVEVTEQNDDTGEVSRLTVNLEKFTNLNMSLFLPLDMFLPVGGYAGIIVNENRYDSPYLDATFDKSKWSISSFLQVNFTAPGDINTEISGWYNSGEQEGIITSDWIYGVNLGVSKKFLDDKLKLSVGVQDIFNRFWYGRIDYSNMDADIVSHWNTKLVSFRANYKFGNQHFKSRDKKGNSASDEINRVKTD